MLVRNPIPVPNPNDPIDMILYFWPVWTVIIILTLFIFLQLRKRRKNELS